MELDILIPRWLCKGLPLAGMAGGPGGLTMWGQPAAINQTELTMLSD